MSDFKFKAIHLFGIPSCKEGKKVTVTYFDNSLYIESDFKSIYKIQEIVDIQFLEDDEIKSKISVIKTVVAYSLLGVFGAVWSALSGIKTKHHHYLYIQTNSDEFVFEIKQSDIQKIENCFSM